MYVHLQQFAAVLLPLLSTRLALFQGNTVENSGKGKPETGFKSPTEHRRKSNRPQETTPSIDSLPMAFSVVDWNRKKVDEL